jgi:hypothetical protein
MPYARNIPLTFECRPTSAATPPDALPDELMIDWGGISTGARATIYLPAVSAEAIVTMARKLYFGRPLTALDAHTVGCDASGLTYVPIPIAPAPEPGYAGLLSIILPSGMRVGQSYRVTVRQLTNVTASGPQRPVTALPDTRTKTVRKALGAFQINVDIQSAASLLKTEEQNLARFRWILRTLQDDNRWFPVLRRYVDVLANRVETLGGKPAQIKPSPTGAI